MHESSEKVLRNCDLKLFQNYLLCTLDKYSICTYTCLSDNQWRSQPKPDASAQLFYPPRMQLSYIDVDPTFMKAQKCPIYLGMHAYNTLLKVHV